MKKRALPLLTLALLWPTASSAFFLFWRDVAGLKTLQKALNRPGAVLARALKGKVCVADFSDLSQPGYTSEFGQKVAELLSTRLVARDKKGAFRVMERRELAKIVHDSVLMVGDDTKAIQSLQKQAGIQALVSGNYSVSGTEVSITLKAVDAASGAVLASQAARFKLTPGLTAMIQRRFQEFGGQAQAPAPAQAAPEPAPASDVGDLLEVEAGVFYEGGDGKLYPVREGMVLTSKDNYAVYLKPREPAYVYVYQVDSSHRAFKLFPSADAPPNPLSAGREYWLPSDSRFFFLDENPGREDIYLFASPKPLAGLDAIAQAQAPDIQDAIRTMGLGGIRGSEVVTKVQAAEHDEVELLARKLTARGGFVYRLDFVHQAAGDLSAPLPPPEAVAAQEPAPPPAPDPAPPPAAPAPDAFPGWLAGLAMGAVLGVVGAALWLARRRQPRDARETR